MVVEALGCEAGAPAGLHPRKASILLEKRPRNIFPVQHSRLALVGTSQGVAKNQLYLLPSATPPDSRL